MQHSIKVSQIKVTEKTARLTKLSTVEEIIANQDGLFTGLQDAQLMELINDIYNGKLKDSDINIISALDTEGKRLHAVNALSFQPELIQESTRKQGDSANVNTVGFFLKNRINVTNQTSLKYFWQTMDLATIIDLNITKDSNFSEIMKNQGYFTYILRTNSFNPEVNKDGMITSSPKRAGKGGDLLLKSEKLIFAKQDLVMQKFDSVEEYDELYDTVSAMESANTEEFKHDAVIDVVVNDIPVELRQKDGTFNPEFQTWLHESVNVGLGNQVEIKNVAVAA